MPRENRICLPELTYHTMSRCIEGKHLMSQDEMKDLMLFVLKMALEKYRFELVFYTLMDNHFHFIIRTLNGGETISRIMQYIKSQFARRYNRMMKRIGPFWNERFKDNIMEFSIDPAATFFTVLLYIAYNPVKSKIVKDPRDYLYSSIMCYVNDTYIAPVKITLHEYYIKMGKAFTERRNKFLEYEEMYRKRILPATMFS
ncbi:MAG: transposase [Spirochaetes bacterium]|nr:transposase [Spirochaetota bacterium]